MSRALILAACALLVSAPPAFAQFMNRAIWLGTEEESFRRDFPQDAEYFIDRAGYVDAPPWWREETLDPFANRAAISAGSVTSKELTVESSLQLGLPLGKGATFRAQHLGSEHQSARFQRYAVGLDVAVSDSSAVLFQLEGTADKARADVSFGYEFGRTERSAHRVLATFADWSTGKSTVFEYDRQPYGLMAAGWYGDPDGWQVAYDLSTQLPFEEREIDTGTVLDLQRTIGLAELRVPLGPRDWLVVGFDGEFTDKARRTADPAALDREDGSVERARLRLDWWHRPDDGLDWAVGVWGHRLDEDYERPNDPTETRRVRRRSAGVAGRMRIPLDPDWTLEPYVIAGHVDLDDATGGVDEPVKRDPFQGKLGAPLLFRFSDAAFLRVDLSLQLDEFAFGGGGVQLRVSF